MHQIISGATHKVEIHDKKAVSDFLDMSEKIIKNLHDNTPNNFNDLNNYYEYVTNKETIIEKLKENSNSSYRTHSLQIRQIELNIDQLIKSYPTVKKNAIETFTETLNFMKQSSKDMSPEQLNNTIGYLRNTLIGGHPEDKELSNIYKEIFTFMIELQ